jgi:hypothetical protein
MNTPAPAEDSNSKPLLAIKRPKEVPFLPGGARLEFVSGVFFYRL